MATDSWSSGTLHGSDANFRTWGLELSTKLQAMTGLVKTSDTGQINWGTVTRPAANTDGGYEVYYLNDSLHGTAPIYFKLYYGTHTSAANPRFRVEFGTGSNGSGTLTGTGSGTVTFVNSSATGSATGTTSYLCVKEGFIGLCWKENSAGWFSISRTCDADGTINAKGALITVRGQTGTTTIPMRCFRYESTAAAYPSGSVDTDNGIFNPYCGDTGLLPSGNNQAWVCFGAFPDIRPLSSLCVVVTADFAVGATISVAMVGATSHTFIVLPNANTNYPGAVDVTTYRLAMWWE